MIHFLNPLILCTLTHSLLRIFTLTHNRTHTFPHTFPHTFHHTFSHSTHPTPPQYLLVATDKELHFITPVGRSNRLRLLAGGHACGDYGKPKVSWDRTGKYVYCNSDEGDAVCVYDLSSERPARVVCGAHGGQAVRDVVCMGGLGLGLGAVVATASYDKSVAVWRCASDVNVK